MKKILLKPRSIIIKLSPDYLDTLASREHTLTASFTDDNNVSVKINIIEKR